MTRPQLQSVTLWGGPHDGWSYKVELLHGRLPPYICVAVVLSEPGTHVATYRRDRNHTEGTPLYRFVDII